MFCLTELTFHTKILLGQIVPTVYLGLNLGTYFGSFLSNWLLVGRMFRHRLKRMQSLFYDFRVIVV